jgi:VWFA-related protein
VKAGESVAPAASSGPGAGATAPAVEPGAPVGTSYLVFVDDYFATETRRNEVLQSLKQEVSRLGPNDRMAIVAHDGGRLSMLSNWSSSSNHLQRAFDVAMGRPARGLDRVTELRSFASDQSFASQTVGDGTPLDLNVRAGDLSLQATNYGKTLVRQMEAVVSGAVSALRTFAQPPGRKVMLLLSGGWPFSVQSFISGGNALPTKQLKEGEEVFRPLTGTANLLGYTIYPVDVPGIEAGGTDASSLGSASGGSLFAEQEIEGALEFLAKETGGTPIRNSNRTIALAEAVADTRSYYWLGFTPTWHGDDKHHKIEVDVVKPGMKARSRTGFRDLSKKAEVAMLVESALLFGNVPGLATMPMKVGAVSPANKGMTEIPLVLGLPFDVLTFIPVEGKYKAQAELRFAASDENGNSSEIPSLPINLTLPGPPKPGGFGKFETKVSLRGKASHMVVALYDPISGKLATAETDLGQ